MLRTACLLPLLALLAAGEPLVCRGFDAGTAVQALVSAGGRLLALDAGLRERRVWFAVRPADEAAARQALAHAIGCWWTPEQLTAEPRLAVGSAAVRVLPPLPATPSGSEALLRRLLDPWLGGPGGLAVDPLTGAWTATAPPAGLARLEQLLAALGDAGPRAPHLLPLPSADPVLVRPPEGAGIGAWLLDLARTSGLSVALGPEVDPAAPAPAGRPGTMREALAALARAGYGAGIHHGCLGVGLAGPIDRLHPALRAAVAVLPVAHLCRDGDEVGRLAAQLAARVEPGAWDQPGWGIAPLAWRLGLLVVADPPAIHAVMTALEAADQAGLEAWLR